MPTYDVECPNCGIYERATSIACRRERCYNCGAEVSLLITSSTRSKGFEPYFDVALGVEVTGVGQRRQIMRQMGADFRDHPSAGDRTARLDRIADSKRKRRTGTDLTDR